MSGKPKQARQSQNTYKGVEKAARAAVESPPDKEARQAPNAEGDDTWFVRVRMHRADTGGAWSILDVTRDEHERLLKLIQDIEKLPAKEAFSSAQNCQQYPDMTDCPNADTKKRLVDEYQGLDSLVRFRLDGTTRVYGARERHEFHLLWWDRDHQVWPSKKKHT
jgi:hypothetical protein